MRTVIAGASLALGAALAACQSVTYSSDRLNGFQLELNRQYSLWQGQLIRSYDYTFSRTCLCSTDLQRPVVVSVVDASVAAVRYLDDSTAVPDSTLQSYFTVEQLFGQIQTAVRLLPDSMFVEYDRTLHYPTQVLIDQSWQQEGDELALFATDLHPKPATP